MKQIIRSHWGMRYGLGISYPFATPRPKPRRPAPSSFFFRNSVLLSLVCVASPSIWFSTATPPRSSACWFCWTASSAAALNTRQQQTIATIAAIVRCICEVKQVLHYYRIYTCTHWPFPSERKGLSPCVSVQYDTVRITVLTHRAETGARILWLWSGNRSILYRVAYLSAIFAAGTSAIPAAGTHFSPPLSTTMVPRVGGRTSALGQLNLLWHPGKHCCIHRDTAAHLVRILAQSSASRQTAEREFRLETSWIFPNDSLVQESRLFRRECLFKWQLFEKYVAKICYSFVNETQPDIAR